MKPLEELRAAHAATTQGEWKELDVDREAPYVVADQGKAWNNPVVCNLYDDVTPEDSVTLCPWYEQTENAAANSAFIALAHNEFPAMLEEIEWLRGFKDAVCDLLCEHPAFREDLVRVMEAIESGE